MFVGRYAMAYPSSFIDHRSLIIVYPTHHHMNSVLNKSFLPLMRCERSVAFESSTE